MDDFNQLRAEATAALKKCRPQFHVGDDTPHEVWAKEAKEIVNNSISGGQVTAEPSDYEEVARQVIEICKPKALRLPRELPVFKPMA